jgi:outer membrane autotransporter protein
MKAIALAALALGTMATPALAGPYVESKHEFKGTDEDYSKAVHQGRVGYETKVGALTPYIEGGAGIAYPDGGDSETFTALEVGSKVKLTDKFSAYGKWENIFQSDSTRDWKVELGTKYKF